MHRSGQHESARHISHQAFRIAWPRASFYKKILIIVSYATACAIFAFGMAFWPASAGNFLTKVNVLPAHLTSTSYISKPIHKADRLSGVSFKERWSAVPAPRAEPADKENRNEPPRAEGRIEKIPFSCELAFSRLVQKGNFSTRCVAGLETSKTNTRPVGLP